MMPKMNGWQFLDELHHDASLNAIAVVVGSSGSYPTKEIESLSVAAYLRSRSMYQRCWQRLNGIALLLRRRLPYPDCRVVVASGVVNERIEPSGGW